jgi:hypothetical protein
MKVQYKYNKRIKKKEVYIIILFFFISFLTYFFPTFFFNLFSSVKEAQEKVSISVSEVKKLSLENQELKKKIEIYENNENLLFFYKNENEELKEKMGYQEFSANKRKYVKVINSGNSNIYKTFLLNDEKGDVNLNDLVFYKFNLLIGKIVNKVGNIAQIEMFSQLGIKNTFYLYDGGTLKMKIEGVGQGSGVIRVDAPRDIVFENKQKVFLTNIKNNSYLVAELVDETFKTQDTNKILYFKIFANLDLLSQVEIQSDNSFNISDNSKI